MDGRNFFQSGYISPTIEIMVFLFVLPVIITSLVLREHGMGGEKKLPQRFVEKSQNCQEMKEPSMYGVTVSKLVPSCILMNASKQPVD